MPCKLTNAAAKAAYQIGGTHLESRTSPVGVQRRLQALHAIGWTWTALSDELGLSGKQVVHNMAGAKDCACAHVEPVKRVSALYDRLWDVYPEGTAALRARKASARKGWSQPLAWDDDMIDDPYAQPSLLMRDASQLSFEQRCEVARELLDMGGSLKDVAAQAQIGTTTVKKLRTAA